MSRDKLIAEQQVGVCGNYVESFQMLLNTGRMNQSFASHLADCDACGLAVDHVIEWDRTLAAKIAEHLDCAGGLTPGYSERNEHRGQMVGCGFFVLLVAVVIFVIYNLAK